MRKVEKRRLCALKNPQINSLLAGTAAFVKTRLLSPSNYG